MRGAKKLVCQFY